MRSKCNCLSVCLCVNEIPTFDIEVEGIDNAPVIMCHLSIGITTVTVIKIIITNSLNSVHTKK